MNQLAPENPRQDFVDFRKKGNQLEYDPASAEAGFVGLKDLDQLELGHVWVDSEKSPFQNRDPHFKEKGYYEVPAISLTDVCEVFDPEFILLWLPNEQLFGSWDSDHWDLFVFERTPWSDIANNPPLYLNAMWRDSERTISRHFEPFHSYEFKNGRPF